MWNIPRVLPTSLLASLCCAAALLLLGRPPALFAHVQAQPHGQPQVKILPAVSAATDAACGDVIINEVLFNGADEWVELFVVNPLPAGTVLRVTDDDSGAFDFAAEFTLAAEIGADLYIVVHGQTEVGSQEPTIGALNIFEAGDGSGDLANSNDNLSLTVDGVLCEEVYWRASDGSNSPAFAAPETLVYTGSADTGESIARNPNGPGGDFVIGTTAGLFNDLEGNSIGRNNVTGTLPVTLAWFLATSLDDGTVRFDWQTATEIANAGFNLLAATPDGLTRVNEVFIPSSVIDAVEPTAYSFTAASEAVEFYLQEVALDGTADVHGPFRLGQASGVPVDGLSGEADHRIYLPFVIE